MSKARDIASAAPAPAGVTSTELGYVDGVTSAIQTQINAQIPKSTVTAKGDLIVGTGSGAFVAQGVGANGTVLTANSAQADGVEWANAVASVSGTAGRITVTGTGTPTIDLATSGVTAGTYGSSTTIPQVAVDAYGRVTSISNAGLTASSAMTFVGTQTATNGGITFSGIPTHKSLRMYVSQVNTSGNASFTGLRLNGITTNTYGTVQFAWLTSTAPNYASYQNPNGGSVFSQEGSTFCIGSTQSNTGNIHYIIDFVNSGFATTRKFVTAITHGQGNSGTLFPTPSYMVQSTADLVVTSLSFGHNWTGTGSIRADLFAIN